MISVEQQHDACSGENGQNISLHDARFTTLHLRLISENLYSFSKKCYRSLKHGFQPHQYLKNTCSILNPSPLPPWRSSIAWIPYCYVAKKKGRCRRPSQRRKENVWHEKSRTRKKSKREQPTSADSRTFLLLPSRTVFPPQPLWTW